MIRTYYSYYKPLIFRQVQSWLSFGEKVDMNGAANRESLHLIIIGAGLAGLGTAVATKVANPNHQVTILESVKELAEIGVSFLFSIQTTARPSPQSFEYGFKRHIISFYG